jgi:hypothetical protein
MLRKSSILLVLPASMIFSYFFLLKPEQSGELIIAAKLPYFRGTSSNTRVFAEKLASYKMVYGKYVGIGASTPSPYNEFELFSKVAIDSELVKLTSHSHPIVRILAFGVLVKREHRDVFPIFLEHLNDTAVYKSRSGCIVSNNYVNASFLQIIRPSIYVDTYEKYRNEIVAMYEPGDWNLRMSGLLPLFDAPSE